MKGKLNTPMFTVDLSLQQYKEILCVALDHQLKYLEGKLLFDQRDPAVEHYKILRASIEKYLKRKNLKGLKKMLQALIESFFVFNDEYNFSQYLFDRTGYRITPIPKEYISLSNRRSLHLSVAGKGEHSITTLQILLPTDSGIIYSVKGSFPRMKAEWTNEHTIEIEVPATTHEYERVRKVIYHGETIRIIYREQESQPPAIG